MDKNLFSLNYKIYSINNDILIEIVNDLQQLMVYSKDNLIITTLKNAINKINYIINDNRKNLELIVTDVNKMYNQMNKQIDDLKNNINNNNQELQFDKGKYVGQLINGLPEGKGIIYFNNGGRYEGDWKNGRQEGKGIFYYNNGNRYEGDWKQGKKDGKGIYYYNNGNRSMNDYCDGKEIGKHVILTKDGEVKTANY